MSLSRLGVSPFRIPFFLVIVVKGWDGWVKREWRRGW